MNLDTKIMMLREANTRRTSISDAKGPEYTLAGDAYGEQDTDVLANFKHVGDELELDALVVCSVYLKKHLDSIYTFMRRYQACEDEQDQLELCEQGEGIISRLDDARNYLDLFECLLFEKGLHPDSGQESSVFIQRKESS